MSPFNIVHETSYSTLIEIVCLCCTIFELQRVICQKSPILTYPPALGSHHSNFTKIFGVRKQESLGYNVALFA